MTIYSNYKTALPGFTDHLDHKKPKSVMNSVYKKSKVDGLIQLVKTATSAQCAQDKPIQKLVKECLKKIARSELEKSQKTEAKALTKCYKKIKKEGKDHHKPLKNKDNKAKVPAPVTEKQAGMNKSPTPSLQAKKEQNLVSTFQASQLGKRSQEIAFAMDWSKHDPILFDTVYVNDLILQQKSHPDIQNTFIDSPTQTLFLNHISSLMQNEQVANSLGLLLSKENTARLKLMMLAIMNHINAQRNEPHFQQLYATIVQCICRAMDNCSNRINTETENIYTGLNYPKEGVLGFRIYLALQDMRRQIFQKAIHLCVAKNSYYLPHEAASINYYNRKMTAQFGLPPSISEFDLGYEAYVMKDQENLISEIFKKEYTPLAIFKKILEIIQDPYDISIPCKLFTDWIEAHYSSQERTNLLDDEGRYRPECFIRLFKELEIFA